MEEITLYTTGCPSCMVLEKKLIDKKINFTKVFDIEELKKINKTFFPILKVGENIFEFRDAITWVNKQECKE